MPKMTQVMAPQALASPLPVRDCLAVGLHLRCLSDHVLEQSVATWACAHGPDPVSGSTRSNWTSPSCSRRGRGACWLTGSRRPRPTTRLSPDLRGLPVGLPSPGRTTRRLRPGGAQGHRHRTPLAEVAPEVPSVTPALAPLRGRGDLGQVTKGQCGLDGFHRLPRWPLALVASSTKRQHAVTVRRNGEWRESGVDLHGGCLLGAGCGVLFEA